MADLGFAAVLGGEQRRARCTSSGTFLTVIEAMMSDYLECLG
jgi:hypothetical protein